MENEEWRRDKKEGQQISAGPLGLFQEDRPHRAESPDAIV
jgi:hypothetical protein